MDDSSDLHPAIRGLKTVCRCNNIKYRTIERAIRQGASTLAAVAQKTTATTGHCGGSCTPDVQQMLAEHGCAVPSAPTQTAAADAWWVRKK
jgi:NAD(P)H-nitrite reductase large subunit